MQGPPSLVLFQMGGVTTLVSQKQEKGLPEREFEQLVFGGQEPYVGLD